MANIDLDTDKIRSNGNDIMKLSIELNDVFVELFNRINNMPIKTAEWTGPAARAFAEKVNAEKIQYFELKETLYKFGNILVNSADDFDNAIRKSKSKVD